MLDQVGLLRGVLLVVLAGVTGFALAALGGHTAAAPGGVAAWLMLFFLSSIAFPRSVLTAVLTPDFLITAFLRGSISRSIWLRHNEYQTVSMAWPTAAAIMVLVVGAVMAAAWLRFVRRDVA